MTKTGSSSRPGTNRPRVLAVDDDRVARVLIERTLSDSEIDVVGVEVDEAEHLIEAEDFDLILCDGSMPGTSGLQFLEHVRALPRLDSTPFIFVTSASEPQEILAGLKAGADDYITKPFQPEELLNRVSHRIERASQARDSQIVDLRTFDQIVEQELTRVSRGDAGGVLAIIDIPNLSIVEAELGEATRRTVIEHVAAKLDRFTEALDTVGVTRHGDLAVLMPATSAEDAADRLRLMAFQIASLAIAASQRTMRLVPTIGFAEFSKKKLPGARELNRRAVEAARLAGNTGDLQPRRWLPTKKSKRKKGKKKTDHHPIRELLQVVATFFLGIGLPYLIYFGLYRIGVDVSWPIYLTCVIALVFTGVMIWAEAFAAMRHPGAPSEAGEAEPPASAIICAYLPNEAATIVETVEHFLTLSYDPGIQVILAYNTPKRLPVEDELEAIAAEHPNLLLLHVEESNSKAQNVNAAIPHATGDFIGVFDADHHPEQGSFSRAWRWLSNGYDIVQGHCLVRNPEETFLAKMVAVEFETIYGTNHPGRWVRDGFGIFGGSNGYWRSEALHLMRMRGSMLTEDIDSSMRLIESGGAIASDPDLISRELATTTAKQIWNQRLRWAQGWTQVSAQHLRHMIRLPQFGLRQRFGAYWLLFHREIYPWLSLQIFPLLLFWWMRGDIIDWTVPIFLAATIFTMTVGPGTTYLSYRLAHPSLKKRAWFIQYALFGVFLYTEAKNVISRVAHLKELLGESSWRVTPRSADPGHAAVLLPSQTEVVHVSESPTESAGSKPVYRLEAGPPDVQQENPFLGPEFFAEWSEFAANAAPGLSSNDFSRALNAANGDSTKQAASTLGLEPLELSMVSFHLWGKSFRQEREERTRRFMGRRSGDNQTDAARDQITRALVTEISAHLRSMGLIYDARRAGRWVIPEEVGAP